MVSHHAPADLIEALATGALGEGEALAVRTHLDLCPECRTRALEAIATRNRSLAAAPIDLSGDRATDGDGPLPPSVASAVEDRYPGRTWDTLPFRPVVPGIRRLMIHRGQGGEATYLLRATPGANLAGHRHRGRELTVILDGQFLDESGQYETGDLQVMGLQDEHDPFAGNEEGCLCLVTRERPSLAFGPVAGLAQRFLKL